MSRELWVEKRGYGQRMSAFCRYIASRRYWNKESLCIILCRGLSFLCTSAGMKLLTVTMRKGGELKAIFS